jgi:hypothetical protein
MIRQEFLQVEEYDTGLGVLSFAVFGSKTQFVRRKRCCEFLGKIAAESRQVNLFQISM